MIGGTREQTAPPEGTHLWHISLEGGQDFTVPNLDESGITAAPSVMLRHLWVLLVASFADLKTLAWLYLTKCLSKIPRVLFKMMKQFLTPCFYFLVFRYGKLEGKIFPRPFWQCLHFTDLSGKRQSQDQKI